MIIGIPIYQGVDLLDIAAPDAGTPRRSEGSGAGLQPGER
jgi:hypothetical protein